MIKSVSKLSMNSKRVDDPKGRVGEVYIDKCWQIADEQANPSILYHCSVQ